MDTTVAQTAAMASPLPSHLATMALGAQNPMLLASSLPKISRSNGMDSILRPIRRWTSLIPL